MKNSHIEWTDHTFNPWEGCTQVSPGCAHCYAEARDQRFTGGIHWGKGAPRRRTLEANWRQPLAWNRRIEEGAKLCGYKVRERVFCASLADWLDDEVPIEWLVDLLALIAATPNLDWLLLTKRPENWLKRMIHACDALTADTPKAAQHFIVDWRDGAAPPNVMAGATVENEDLCFPRVKALVNIPAKVRFLSCEPMLSEIDIKWIFDITGYVSCGGEPECSCEGCRDARNWPRDEHGNYEAIDWVICGGESGHGARPMHPDWARSLRDQCAAAGVPFFFKQWGAWSPDTAPCVAPTHWLWRSGHMETYGAPNASSAVREGAVTVSRHGKLASGRILDGQEHSGRPTP